MIRKIILLLFVFSFVFGCNKERTPNFLNPFDSDEKIPGDARQNTASDRNALVVFPPLDRTELAKGPRTVIDLGLPAVINSNGSVQLSNDAPVDGFPPGLTLVTWQITDADGKVATAVQQVNVVSIDLCSSNRTYFQQSIWPIIRANCSSCHANNVVSSKFNLFTESTPDFLTKNYEVFLQKSFLRDADNFALLLSKASNRLGNHGGGLILPSDSTEYLDLQNILSNLTTCNRTPNLNAVLVPLDSLQLLYKTVFSLADRIPTQEEIDLVLNGNVLPVEQVIQTIAKKVMSEKGFYNRIKEIFNDLLLTDAFKKNAMGLDLALDDYNNNQYFGVTELMQQGYSTLESNQLRQYASDGISQAPLELIAYVVKNDLPFTEILTAEFQMINPYSAKIYSVDVADRPGFEFNYREDIALHPADLFIPAQLVDSKGRSIPHAGILTTQAFLGRYNSSNTNLNRKRAKKVLQIFLLTDVEGIVDRTALDLQAVSGLFPTLEDPQCTICHNILDPVAGLFKNWNVSGRFLGNNLYWLDKHTPAEMLPPGFSADNSQVMPDQNSASSLRWLGSKIVNDERFFLAINQILFKAITGVELDVDPVLQERLKQLFVASGFNLKTLVLEIIGSQYFTTQNASVDASLNVNVIGASPRLISPERLQRKISSIFNGYEWSSPSKRNLLSDDSYLVLYGGIDSVEIVSRTTDPTQFIRGIQLRLANQIACENVPVDFTRPVSERILFPFVEWNNNANDDAQSQLIKKNIQYLFAYLFGDQLDINDLEISRTFELFSNAMNLADPAGISLDCRGTLPAESPLVKDLFGTIQAWMATLNYMLRDFRFLYE